MPGLSVHSTLHCTFSPSSLATSPDRPLTAASSSPLPHPKPDAMSVVASAPGKVLITGGYLILERPNAGIVLSTTARFYAIVKPIYHEIKPESWAWAWADVKLSSPQLFREAAYKLSLKNSTLQCTSSRDSSNPFVERAIEYAVAAAKAISADTDRINVLNKLLLQGLDITILGSNDFYSFRNQIEAHGLALLPETLEALPIFSSITLNTEYANGTISGDICKPEVAKTGLGSSAAMTTSVVAALLQYFGIVNLPLPASDSSNDMKASHDLDLVHIVAQSAHCIAQGKIGSGFDVSTAVYGSQRYVRFSPAVLSSAQVSGINQLPDVIIDVLQEKWDHEKSQFSLPPRLTLLLGEPGSGGSSTPSMVGAVKRWQSTDPHGSSETYRKLSEANSKLEMQLDLLSKLAKEHCETYNCLMNHCSGYTNHNWVGLASDQLQEDIVKALVASREAFLQIREHMRHMGSAAGVPIEPESQSRLLDATMEMEGVLLAGVPGAGGYDAIFAIVLDGAKDAVIKRWSSLGVMPLLVREDPLGVALEHGDPRAAAVASALSSVRVE